MTDSDICEMKWELQRRKYAIPYDNACADYKERITYDYLMMLLYEADYSDYCFAGTEKICDILYNEDKE